MFEVRFICLFFLPQKFGNPQGGQGKNQTKPYWLKKMKTVCMSDSDDDQIFRRSVPALPSAPALDAVGVQLPGSDHDQLQLENVGKIPLVLSPAIIARLGPRSTWGMLEWGYYCSRIREIRARHINAGP